MMSRFKPYLIPNSSPTKPIDLESIIGDNLPDYIISPKKDGCRVEVIDGVLKTRSLKPVKNQWLQDRFKNFAEFCKRKNVIVEGEMYCHEMNFREICRFFNTEDVTDPKHRRKLELHPEELAQWTGRDIDWLCSNHESLQLWMFDAHKIDEPNMRYSDRIQLLLQIHLEYFKSNPERIYNIITPIAFTVNNFNELYIKYNEYLDDGWEGLVLAHKDGVYKFGRATKNEASIFKLKPDNNEYDGKVINIKEGSVVKDGVEKTVNELGNSVTSKKQDDRTPSGMAKSFTVLYEGKPIDVSPQGFTHSQLREIWKNKDEYIGRWMIYSGMTPTKDVPRHAHFKCWRDDK